MNVLGVWDGHNASAVLLVNGRIVAGAQEERFCNQKNYIGFPQRAVSWVLEAAGLDRQELDIVAIPSNTVGYAFDVKLIRDVFEEEQRKLIRSRLRLAARNTPLDGIYRWWSKSERIRAFEKAGFARRQLNFVEHHTCHAAASYFGSPWRDQVLVLTLDGGGDRLAATVSVGSGRSIERIAVTPDTDSVGNLYSRVTFLLGFVPWEHEYKVMGLAPYASRTDFAPLKTALENCIGLSPKNPLAFKRNIPEPTRLVCRRLQRAYRFERFDRIAGALQEFTEELVLKWVHAAINKTGIRKLALGGGVFMNVKVNKLIAEMSEVEDIFVFPSCGDETNSIGAAFHLYASKTGETPGPIGPIYWGPEFPSTSVEDIVKKCVNHRNIEYEYVDDIEGAIVELLLNHNIVARASGKMEFGARALGNRSILADPSDLVTVQAINRMIKMRDFWMPFAPVVMSEKQDDYLVRTKPIRSPYMMMAFDTQHSRRHEIIAAVHQSDGTARPQVIERDDNPSYYEIVDRFEKSTGRGALLNTSFNLHGYPIVLGPREATWVFENSGLEYLALGHYLLRKKSG
jgi:carbamoyltransferase